MKTKYPSSLAIMFCSYQLACGQAPADTATPPSAVSTNPPVVLKIPVILLNGKQVELQGQWLFAKDGTPVFAQTEPIQASASNAPQGGSGQSLVLLVPAGGSAYAPQYQYFVFGTESVYHYYYPYYHSYRGGYYYRSSVYGGYSGYYRPHHSSGGGARYGYRSDGARVLIPSHRQ